MQMSVHAGLLVRTPQARDLCKEQRKEKPGLLLEDEQRALAVGPFHESGRSVLHECEKLLVVNFIDDEGRWRDRVRHCGMRCVGRGAQENQRSDDHCDACDPCDPDAMAPRTLLPQHV